MCDLFSADGRPRRWSSSPLKTLKLCRFRPPESNVFLVNSPCFLVERRVRILDRVVTVRLGLCFEMRSACPIIDSTHGMLQNLFGCDCVDGQHPNFAKYLGQPCRTLLKPTSGAMYYIKVPGPTSPSIRDCRSFWKWKKPGSDETLGAGQGEPRLHYEKFDCKPKNTPEHHPPEQIPSFVARVYSFHKSTCRLFSNQSRL